MFSEGSDEDSQDKSRVYKNVVLNITVGDRNKPLCWVNIGGVRIQLAADSGSPYSIVAKQVWE